MSHKQVLLKAFGVNWVKKFTKIIGKQKQLIARIKLKLKDFDSKDLQTLMMHANTYLRKIGGI